MINYFKAFTFIIIFILSFYLISTFDAKILADQSLLIKLVMAFVSGLFYTSFLTAPLSIVLFVILAQTTNIYLVTVIAGFGAVSGDLLIVKFFRMVFKTFSLVIHVGLFKNIKNKLQSYHLDIIAFFLGVIIIASPLPDELGLVLLGASRLSYFKLSILTFILNSIGILVILYTTKIIS